MALMAVAGSRRRQLFDVYLIVIASIAILVVVSQSKQVVDVATEQPAFWFMAGFALLAGTQAYFEPPTPGRAATVICPTLCFTFAILLGWGLGPALAAQAGGLLVAAVKLRRPIREALEAAAAYTFAFVAASVVLWFGQPDPLQRNGPTNLVSDAITVVAAVAAWLIAYAAVSWLTEWLRMGCGKTRHTASSLGNQLLFKTALLLLSPVLAVAAHISIGFVPLVLVPLYAVQRMARLSAERDRAARLDPLTNLANRTGLRAGFDELVETCSDTAKEPHPKHPTLFMLDLDRFKHVNDALGHDVGDQLLIAVSQRISAVRPDGATVARLGGDEFAILAATTDGEDAQAVSRQVVRALADPITLDGLRIDVTASIGIATHTGESEDFATLLRHADVAMYDAKQSGDSIAGYVAQSNEHSPERLSLLTDLRDALLSGDTDQIAMHYQPQVSLVSGQVEGVEALLRWRHPVHGPIDTQELMSVVEHSSVMRLLTVRVIDAVVGQVADWAARGVTVRASLNISARDLYSDELVSHLARQLVTHQVKPSQIQLEITESALLADPSRAQATVTRIAALGVAIALDDFGTGYSSLQHLRKLPITEIKIDRSFVAGMADNHDDAAIVRSTVDMARSLGIRVVAEGVETEYTRQLLAEAGCDLVQGWLTARPMAGPELTNWLAGVHRPSQPSQDAANRMGDVLAHWYPSP